MTKRMKKERDAQAAFQKEMDQFGLTVNTRSTCGTYSTDGKYFLLEVRTEQQPVKGKKALIKKIEAAGYIARVWGKGRRNSGGFVFNVVKTFPILCEDDDAQEYVEETK